MDTACIIGKDGSKWTSDIHPSAIKLETNEAAKIGANFRLNKLVEFQPSGAMIEGTKWMYLSTDDNSGAVTLKKKDVGLICMAPSHTAIVICLHKGERERCCKEGALYIANYLIGQNM